MSKTIHYSFIYHPKSSHSGDVSSIDMVNCKTCLRIINKRNREREERKRKKEHD